MNSVTRVLLGLAISSVPISLVAGQDFGPQRVISANMDVASVFAIDLDGDGDADVLSASTDSDTVAWHENVGPGNGVVGGNFGPQQVITSSADGATSVLAIDLDEDGDADVLVTSRYDKTVAWYANVGVGNGIGGGSFGSKQIISATVVSVMDAYAADLDLDGDADVLSASPNESSVSWNENLGGGVFGPRTYLSGNYPNILDLHASDLDGDGLMDVLSTSWTLDGLYWNQNLGGLSFGPQQNISKGPADGPRSIFSADLDGDGDSDVLSASDVDHEIASYENLGGGSFGPQQVISSNATGAASVFAIDLDNDGDVDVLSASSADNKIAWYENLGAGLFGPEQVITINALMAVSVFAIDLDGDGDADVLSGSRSDDKLAWYENFMGNDCNGNGVQDSEDITSGTSTDCNANWVPDECEIAGDPSLDCDLDGVLDSCEINSDPGLDCDGDGNLDTCQLAGDPSLDQDGDGVLDSCQCTFSSFCISTGNSTGLPGTIGWSGSASITANDLTLTASDLPPFQFGIFFYGADEWFNIMGDGVLCIAPPLYRIKTVVTTGTAGAASLAVDYNTQPFASGAGQVVAFSTWRFQLWYRDPTGGPAGSNTTDGLMVTFCP